jgi:hypothetical protein
VRKVVLVLVLFRECGGGVSNLIAVLLELLL